MRTERSDRRAPRRRRTRITCRTTLATEGFTRVWAYRKLNVEGRMVGCRVEGVGCSLLDPGWMIVDRRYSGDDAAIRHCRRPLSRSMVGELIVTS